MPIAGMIAEGALTIVLLVAVSKFLFGWQPKLSPVRVALFSFLLITANITVMHFLQEQSETFRAYTFLSLALPLLLLGVSCDLNDRVLSKGIVVISAAWILVLVEAGLTLKSYFVVLSLTVILVLAFQLWRDPKEEGFIKTKLADWKAAAGAICVFLTFTVLMVVVGWESIMITDYPAKLSWLPLLSAALFVLVKAIPEELVFRGIFQGALKDRFGFFPALIGSTTLYGVAALNNPATWAFPNWHAVVNSVMLGIGCGVVYNKTKSLAVSGILNAAISFIWWFSFARGGN